jgi:hypothetical protein
MISGVAGLLLGVGPIKKSAMKIVDKELKDSLPCKYELGGISAGFPRGVELQNLRLFDPADGREFLSVRSLRLTLGLGSIFHPSNPFTGVVVGNAIARVSRRADGRINIIEIMEKMNRKQVEGRQIPRVTLDGVRVEWSDYELGKNPPREKFNIESATILIGDKGEYALRDFRIKKGGSALTLRGKWNDTPGVEVSLRLRAEPLILKDFLTLSRSFSETRALPEINASGEGIFDFRIFGPRGREQANGELTLVKGLLGGKKFKRAGIRFSPASGGKIEISDFTVRMDAGGRLRAGGVFSSTAPWPFEIKAKSDGFPIDAVIGMIQKQPPISGALNAEISAKGNAEDVMTFSGEGSFELRGGKIYGLKGEGGPPVPFRSMTARLKAENGIVGVTDGVLDSDELLLQLKGSVGLNRTLNLSGKCEVSKGMVRKGFFKKVVSTVLPDGSVGYRFPVNIRGTFDNPDVRVKSGKLAEDSVADQVRDAGNKVEKFFKKVF